MYNDLAYAPFGEQYAQSGSTGVTDTSFAGNDQDTSANLYDAQFRGIRNLRPLAFADPGGAICRSLEKSANAQSIRLCRWPTAEDHLIVIVLARLLWGFEKSDSWNPSS